MKNKNKNKNDKGMAVLTLVLVLGSFSLLTILIRTQSVAFLIDMATRYEVRVMNRYYADECIELGRALLSNDYHFYARFGLIRPVYHFDTPCYIDSIYRLDQDQYQITGVGYYMDMYIPITKIIEI